MNGKDFKILALTDIHFGLSIRDVISTLIDKHQPDFAFFNGDNANFQTDVFHLDELARLFTENKLKWSATFGNHDRKSYYSTTNLLDESRRLENYDDFCLYTAGPLKWDDIYGNGSNVHGAFEKYGTYAIDITDGGVVMYKLIIFDSGPFNELDYAQGNGWIEKYQVDWYEKTMVQAAIDRFGDFDPAHGHVVPSLVFMHIPMIEAFFALIEALGDNNYGDIPPEFGWGLTELYRGREFYQGASANLLETMQKVGGTHAFFGHIHEYNAAVEYEGIKLIFLNKSGHNNYSILPTGRTTFVTEIVIRAGTYVPDVHYAMPDGTTTRDPHAWENN